MVQWTHAEHTTQESNTMNKVYLVKEIQYDWVTVLAVYTCKIKADLHCKELLSHKASLRSVVNYIVDEHKVVN